MKLFISAIIFLFAVQSYTQVKIVSDSVNYQEVKSDLFHSSAKITFKDGTVFQSYLLGITDDALFVSVKKVHYRVPLSDVSKIAVDDKYVAGWNLGGLYIGGLIFFSGMGKENYSPVYLIGTDVLTPYRAIFNLAAMGLIAGVGAIIHWEEGDETFYFNGSSEEIIKETERLKEFLLVDKPVKNNLQFSFETAFVNTTYSKVKNHLESGEDGVTDLFTNFNMLRKIQAVYSVGENVDVGAAYVITGEPSFTWKRYYPGGNEGSYDLVGHSSYSGYGIYPILQNNLTNSFPSLFFDVVAGGGPGIAKINNSISQNESNKNTLQTIDKSVFSGYFFTNIRFRINPTTLIALSADYVFIPEKKFPIDFLNIKAESFSNFSYGISLLFEM